MGQTCEEMSPKIIHIHGELMDLPLDHHVLHAAVVAGLLHLEPGAGSLEPPEVTSEEQRVVGVSGADPGDSDAGLSEDLLTERVTTFLTLRRRVSHATGRCSTKTRSWE